ncbi:putative S-adenosyl-L-methionine-dependent methyltransferase [Helianthus annuus]|nr:putative S-adenosyl-L-methionine-dependent methyltransferase [Helianthus annuus]KAJ0596408.1 putative S-adenosyl-L-methionine-dependent methyltransferase [Helianthus annuus]KAJ0757067.1 putative S-adenosyl-L-methionine-dependent methyltransferase [Helianthus annuus]KAJ0760801.1 putative S-adenosyl-L-methionine-dependent methyltransferase [Helianthus annuus]KAJ0930625.1 putative S-adenosyl-L-methionine-dependent methyltransferase [Helianthus annuus]
MAQGKYSRVDGKKSSSCSTATIIVVVGVCLVGVWMFMSSSAAPGQNSDLPVIQESKQKESTKVSSQFEDNSGDLSSDDSAKDESNQENTQNEESSTNENDTNTEDESKSTEENSNSNESENSNSDSNESENSNSESNESESSNTNSESNESENSNSESNESENSNSDANESEKKEEKVEKDETEENSSDNKTEDLSAATQSEISKETNAQNGAFSTQEAESATEKQSQKPSISKKNQEVYQWKTCNVSAGPDYIPCLDNLEAIRHLHGRSHYEHRERHCPTDPPTCLVSLPIGYKTPIKWPRSREQIWYSNVPHTKLAAVKGHQNWVKVTGEYLSFPGGGTQFKNGALHYIDFIQNTLPDIAWGKRTRVILDVGCGVASFGGYLFERDVVAFSFAPKDEHEAQVQFALERGIPAISAVMGTKRLPFPSKIFDVVHCARCRVPWHIEGGKLLLELNRVLRPGGYFVWSATPVYQNKTEDVEIWEAMSKLTKAMCWELVVINNDKLNEVGAAIYRKPTSNECYESRQQNEPPLCDKKDDPDAVWNVQLEACMHKVPTDESVRGSKWPEMWPQRLESPPYWLKSSEVGVYGKPAPEDFTSDYENWKRVVAKSYLTGLGIDWSTVRNVMDMRSIYGGFAAAMRDLKIWVMNVVPLDSPDTLPIIYERGLFGIYHDWCESFSTYPRTYDLLHADHLFSDIKKRCKLQSLMAEVDRILRPEGKLIVRDNIETIAEVENMAKSMNWIVRMTYNKDNEGMLCVEKSFWRPDEVETLSYAIE